MDRNNMNYNFRGRKLNKLIKPVKKNISDLKITNKEFIDRLMKNGRADEYLVDLLVEIMNSKKHKKK